MPQFYFQQYSDLDIFREAVDNLIDLISKEGGILNLQPLFFRLTLNVTSAFLFGETTQSLKSPTSVNEQTLAESFNPSTPHRNMSRKGFDFLIFTGSLKGRSSRMPATEYTNLRTRL